MKTLDELKVIRDKMQREVALRVHEDADSKYEKHVLVCGGTGCTSSNSEAIIAKLNEELQSKGLADKVQVVRTGCFGLCALGPIMIVYPEGTFYSMVEVDNIPRIVEEHLANGNPVKELLYDETVQGDEIKALDDTAFYKKQNRVALRNCGVINPECIDEYIGRDGYAALGKVVTEMSQDEVIQTILDSGLRGRGGGGFPTGMKWKLAKNLVPDADMKYVCCNADEGDPGAFMDRSVLEGDPHVVLEAMAIAGYAIGAKQGYIYVRA
ncbi:MAG: NAD(P)H-dependent oxidoreductase subunit E, partial [Oscillospiraceae bacterium]|nr:NAD(P)H-dependent oxidoreductase subunit E [Oscillospiraceae bacterium]